MGLRKIRLIKFRPLASCTDFVRAIKIIENGEFYCAKLWDLNDPMEGVYVTYEPTNESIINEVFSDKNKYVICSFSSIEDLNNPLKNPLLWGYYANGYKGIAIEIDWLENKHGKIFNGKDIDNIESNEINKCIVKVNYIDNISEIKNDDNPVSVPKIISSKLKCWTHEGEYRYLTKSKPSGLIKIGKIKKVHFGNPYGNIFNKGSIIHNSKTLKCYYEYVNYLWQCCIDKHIEPVLFNGDTSEELNTSNYCISVLSQNRNY